jgi:cytochrome P450
MRISRPPADARVPLDAIDLADVSLYTNGDPHLIWQTLRAERPAFWQVRPAGEGFWAVTRHADVRRVLAEYETFTSECGTAIAMLDAPDPAGGRMMQSTDPPRHQQFRQQIAKRFSGHALTELGDQIRVFVGEAIAPALDSQVWDVAESFSRLPMKVAARMMALPEKDIEPLMRLAYASLAPHEPRYRSGPARNTSAFAHYDIIRYFSAHVAKVRENPSDNLISHLLTVRLDDRFLTEEEVLLNCLSLLLGAVVTTTHAINATFIALAEENGAEGHWPTAMPLRGAVEEALRWASPVTHFMRRARRDVEMHGERIRAGEAVTAWIASANRDEAVFDSPYVLDFGRSPNHHVTFGYGSHRCIGHNLARLMIGESFGQLSEIIESFELASPPRHLASNEISGVVSLPLRITLKALGTGRNSCGLQDRSTTPAG